jgi:hypothetical protein
MTDGPPGYGYTHRPDPDRLGRKGVDARPRLSASGARGSAPTGATPSGVPVDGVPRITTPPRAAPRHINQVAKEVTTLFLGVDDPNPGNPIVPPWVPDIEAIAATWTPNVTVDPNGGGEGGTLVENADTDVHGFTTPNPNTYLLAFPGVRLEIHGYAKAAGRSVLAFNLTMHPIGTAFDNSWLGIVDLSDGSCSEVPVEEGDGVVTVVEALTAVEAGGGWREISAVVEITCASAPDGIDGTTGGFLGVGTSFPADFVYEGDDASGVELYAMTIARIQL